MLLRIGARGLQRAIAGDESFSSGDIEVIKAGDFHEGQNRDDHNDNPDDRFERFGYRHHSEDCVDAPQEDADND